MSTEDRSELLRAAKAFANEKRWLSWWHLAATLGLLAAALAIAVSGQALWLRMVGSIAAGLLLVRLFIIYHDYQHGAILQRSWLASTIMMLFGLLSLNPPSIWKRSHNHHHGSNAKIYGSQIGSFPVMTTPAYQRASRREQLAYRASRHPLTVALGYLTVFLFGMCVRSLIVNPGKHFDSAIALLLHASLVVWLAYQGLDVLFFGLLLPMLIGSALGAYLFYAQHNFPGVRLRNRTQWDFVSAALDSSSCMRMNPLMSWLTGNIGIHHVHHLNPRIPFYRLPDAMAEIPALQTPVFTSLGWHDICACFALKLWDPSSGEMVSLAEGSFAGGKG
jgi:omega-6 fatty acid desaturase (delta-12 desaturase)